MKLQRILQRDHTGAYALVEIDDQGDVIAQLCPLRIFAYFYLSNSSSPILGEKHVIDVKATIFTVPEVMSRPCFTSVFF